MRAPKLVQHLKANADGMSERLLEKVRSSPRCSDLLLRVPAEEHKRYAIEIYHDLMEWLLAESDSIIEHRYAVLGCLHYTRVSLGAHPAGMFT
jgi:hypothetical protein